ncbi:hypothetical protein [Actinoplanes sp. NPDC049802]
MTVSDHYEVVLSCGHFRDVNDENDFKIVVFNGDGYELTPRPS